MKFLIGFGFLAVLGGTVTAWGAWTDLTGRGRLNGLHVLCFRWHSGQPLDGKRRSDATWTEPATKATHPKGGRRVHRWHWVRGWRRSAFRCGAELAAAGVAVGMLVARTVTIVLLAIVVAPLMAWLVLLGANRVSTWQHRRHYVRPLHRTLAARGVRPTELTVIRDGGTVKAVTIKWAPEKEIGAEDKQAIVSAVTGRLAIEAPDTAWNLKGRERSVSLLQSDPPPSYVDWEQVAERAIACGPHEFVAGVARKGRIVTASLTEDAAHGMINAGSGGGKSVLVMFLVLQAILRGAVILILDPKSFSHPWAFKDIDARMDQLPCVAYASEPDELHEALCWVGREVANRRRIAKRWVNSQGKIIGGDMGREIWVIGEELNYGEIGLKQHWAEIRDPDVDPKQSPAFDGYTSLATAGRALKMRLIGVGQKNYVATMGGGARGGAVKANMGHKWMARWGDRSTWELIVGKGVPMPPIPHQPGRMQYVIGSEVTEVQIPDVEERVRDLILADPSRLAVCPDDMPCTRAETVSAGTALMLPAPPGLSGAAVLGGPEGARTWPDQGIVPGRAPVVPMLYTLTQARERGILRLSDAAAKKAAQRDGFPVSMEKGRPGVASRWRGSDLARWQAEQDRKGSP
jgi:hypothetical protein